jgi:cellulose synthase/poly-beta-1,6-N-acetylglucosamine synthase-like glycosyltransferase
MQGAALLVLFACTQVLYVLATLCELYIRSRPVDWVDMSEPPPIWGDGYPRIVLLYPVLRELEETMRTTMSALARIDYPADRFRIVAIPNSSDKETVTSLRRMQEDYSFLEVLEVPRTSDPSWDRVWSAWDANPNAYWWHRTNHWRDRDLPPKKTRQLIYAFYTLLESESGEDWLLNYIDADSVPPPDHFLAGAIGMRRFDVLQSTNIAGNLLDTWPASWHAMDHMSWDGHRYPHLGARPKHPYWVLGKGLFYKASDLVEVGGFNPWIAIEDPEVGMRLWANGKRLGIIEAPLIEEVPRTLRGGIKQRKRWVCGFFQSLLGPPKYLGMTFPQRLRAWINFLPCLLLLVNPIGIPVGIWALVDTVHGHHRLPLVLLALGLFNIACLAVSLILIYAATWLRTARVLDRRRDRLRYILRVNPLFLLAWWLLWCIPLVLGFEMYLRDKGLVWERTEKVDANHDLVLALHEQASLAAALGPVAAGSPKLDAAAQPASIDADLETTG